MTATQLSRNAAEIIRRAIAGETTIITSHGNEVAKIVPVNWSAARRKKSKTGAKTV